MSYLGEVILRKDSPISVIYLILSGLVCVFGDSSLTNSSKELLPDDETSQNDNTSTIMTTGEFFGEEGFITGDKKILRTVVAMKETSLCVIDRDLFDDVQIFGPARDQMILDVASKKEIERKHMLKIKEIKKKKPIDKSLCSKTKGPRSGDSSAHYPKGLDEIKNKPSGKRGEKPLQLTYFDDDSRPSSPTSIFCSVTDSSNSPSNIFCAF